MYDKVRIGAVVLLAALTASPLAEARDRWRAPHPAMRHLHRRTESRDIHVVLVDLSNPELRVVATRDGDEPMGTDAFAEAYDAAVALPTALDGGGAWIVRGGADSASDDAVTPRSAVGTSADGRRMVFASIDGATSRELAALMLEFDCADALSVGEGDASAMVLAGRAAHHADARAALPSRSHVGVRVLPGAARFAGEVIRAPSTVAAIAGEPREVDVYVRNTGRVTWRPPGAGGGAPLAQWSDGARGYIASLAEATPPGAVGHFVARWVGDAPGERALSLSLTDPDGLALGPTPTGARVAVAPRPRAPEGGEVAAQPNVAAASLLGAGPPAGPRGLAWACLAVLASGVAAIRRARAE